ncbi:hypothetical protein ACFX19_044247 [Malus domestica]
MIQTPNRRHAPPPSPRPSYTDPPVSDSDLTSTSISPTATAPRHFKDLFLILFLLFVLATFAIGIFVVVHRNQNYSAISSAYNSDSSSCVGMGNGYAGG